MQFISVALIVFVDFILKQPQNNDDNDDDDDDEMARSLDDLK